jgi:hypothetical protein
VSDDACLALLKQAIAIASEQGAASLELRAATDLAELRRSRGDGEAGRKILVPVYEHLSEGREVADMRRAQSVLNMLGYTG